jgi:hypothetical protein
VTSGALSDAIEELLGARQRVVQELFRLARVNAF